MTFEGSRGLDMEMPNASVAGFTVFFSYLKFDANKSKRVEIYKFRLPRDVMISKSGIYVILDLFVDNCCT